MLLAVGVEPVPDLLCKKAVLKGFWNSKGKTCVGVHFWPETTLNTDSIIYLFLMEFFDI